MPPILCNPDADIAALLMERLMELKIANQGCTNLESKQFPQSRQKSRLLLDDGFGICQAICWTRNTSHIRSSMHVKTVRVESRKGTADLRAAVC